MQTDLTFLKGRKSVAGMQFAQSESLFVFEQLFFVGYFG
jgi:hypothetical protein